MGLGMNAFQGMIGRYCLCLCLLGQMLYAEDQADPEAALRAVLAEEPFHPRRVLDTLIASPGMFDSETDTRGFSVELLGRQADGTEVRLIGDYSPPSFRRFEIIDRKLTKLQCDRSTMAVDEEGWPVTSGHVIRVDWSKGTDSGEVADSSNSDRLTASIFDMLDCTQPWKSVEYDSLVHGIRAVHSNGDTLIVVLRSPNDAEQFGSIISHASVWRNGKLIRELRRPTRNSDSEQVLPDISDKLLHDWSEMLASASREGRSVRLPDWLQYRDVHVVPINHDDKINFELQLKSASLIRPPHRKPDAASRRLENSLLQQTTIWSQALSIASTLRHYRNDKSLETLFTDDSAAMWWRMELFVSIEMVGRFVASTTPVLVDHIDAPLNDRAELAEAIGHIGRPGVMLDPFSESCDRLFIEAILFSRWEYPCSQSHVDACAHILSRPEEDHLNCHLAAAETLIRLDRVDLIPKDRMERWWSHRVQLVGSGLPDAILASNRKIHSKMVQLKRWNNICLTSRYRSGRRFLLGRLASSESPQIKRLIWSALQQRAESTLRQQRFDFMSRQECEEILATPQIPDPGRDSEGGKARPFPTLTP